MDIIIVSESGSPSKESKCLFPVIIHTLSFFPCISDPFEKFCGFCCELLESGIIFASESHFRTVVELYGFEETRLYTRAFWGHRIACGDLLEVGFESFISDEHIFEY